MTFEQLEIYAYNDENLPKPFTIEEELAYYMLKDLYNKYRSGKINSENAKIKKSKIKIRMLNDIKQNKFKDKIYKDSIKKMNNCSKYLIELGKSIYLNEDKNKLLDISIKCISNICHDEGLIQDYKEKYK